MSRYWLYLRSTEHCLSQEIDISILFCELCKLRNNCEECTLIEDVHLLHSVCLDPAFTFANATQNFPLRRETAGSVSGRAQSWATMTKNFCMMTCTKRPLRTGDYKYTPTPTT